MVNSCVLPGSPSLPKIIKQKAGLVFEYYILGHVDQRDFVVVRSLVGPADVCAIALLIAGLAVIKNHLEEFLLKFFV